MSSIFFIFQRFFVLFRKELLATIKDPACKIILIVPPLLQSIIFGYAATFDLNNIPYAVLDQSKSEESTRIIEKIDGTGVFRKVEQLRTQDEIADVINDEKALMVVQFGTDFEKNLKSDEAASLQVILDGRNSTTAATALEYFSSIIEDYNTEKSGEGELVEVITRGWYNPNFQSRWNILPNMIAGLSLIQILVLAALSVAREREQGTFDQLLVTPLNTMEIMFGKAVPSILIGLFQSSIILLVSLYWFHIPMSGSILCLMGGLVVFMIACVGVGLAISAISANMQQAMLYAFMIIMPIMLLSGLAIPIKNMPILVQYATWLNPLRFAIEIVQKAYFENAEFLSLMSSMLPLMVMTCITLPFAAWMFKHKLQ